MTKHHMKLQGQKTKQDYMVIIVITCGLLEAVNPKWRLSGLKVRQHNLSLAKSYRGLGAPWKQEPRLVFEKG